MNRDSNSPEGSVPKLRDRIREVTQDTILNASEEVFAEEGLHASKMETIAARAGVSVGTLYNYFTDKGTLFAALVESRHRSLIAIVDAALEGAKGKPFRERLLAMSRAFFSHFDVYRRYFVILIQAEHRKLENGVLKSAPGNTMHELYLRVSELIESGIKEGSLRADMSEHLPVFLLGAFRGVLIRDVLYNQGFGDFEMRSQRLVKFFLEGAEA